MQMRGVQRQRTKMQRALWGRKKGGRSPIMALLICSASACQSACGGGGRASALLRPLHPSERSVRAQGASSMGSDDGQSRRGVCRRQGGRGSHPSAGGGVGWAVACAKGNNGPRRRAGVGKRGKEALVMYACMQQPPCAAEWQGNRNSSRGRHMGRAPAAAHGASQTAASD